MKNISFSRRFLTTCVVICVLFGLVSCSSDEGEKPSLTTDGVVLITNSHANVPRPDLSKGVSQLLGDALDQGLPVFVVSADGTPEVADLGDLKVDTVNPDVQRESRKRVMNRIKAGITVLPNADGAASYDAFTVAIKQANSEGMRRPTFVCIECGLDTQGPLNMTREEILNSDAESIAASLKETGQLVTFGDRFEQADVILQSVGATAAPQQPFSPRGISRLTDIWKGVLTAGGATVTVDEHQPSSREPIETDHTVPTITPPADPTVSPIKPCSPEAISFDGASGARFQPELSEWVDADEAREALRPVAEWLRADTTRTAVVSGTTADIRSGDPEEGKTLSLARARVASDLLIELGVAPGQITDVRGLGPHYSGRIEDREADGTPIPSLMTKNRKIIVELASHC